jgi:methionine synthase II (cobalamin-independent)
MKYSQDRIEVTHVGSLPRWEKLREANKLRLEQGGDLEGFDNILRESVSEVVAK